MNKQREQDLILLATFLPLLVSIAFILADTMAGAPGAVPLFFALTAIVLCGLAIAVSFAE